MYKETYIKKAAGWHQTAYQNRHGTYDKQNKKRKPGFFKEYASKPHLSVTLITANWAILNFIRRLKGICLICDIQSFNQYDFSFVLKREVWLLYSEPSECDGMMQLARILQLAGATKVLLIRINAKLMEANNE